MLTILLANGRHDLRRMYARATPTDLRGMLARVAATPGYSGAAVHSYAADPCYLGM